MPSDGPNERTRIFGIASGSRPDDYAADQNIIARPDKSARAEISQLRIGSRPYIKYLDNPEPSRARVLIPQNDGISAGRQGLNNRRLERTGRRESGRQ